MTDQPTTAADMIRELTHPYVVHHQGHYLRTVLAPVPTTLPDLDRHGWVRTKLWHRNPATRHPALLDQLATATTGGTALGDSDAGTRFGSKPAAHLEALRLLSRIERQSVTLATELGANPALPLRERLGGIAGKLGINPHPVVRSWWVSARIVTHWDAPAYRPQGAPCPNCWETGSLRIRFDDELAVCAECGASWDRTGEPDRGSLDMLGQHVAWCTDHEVTKARHWILDDVGELAECVECLTFRDAYTEWRMARHATESQGVA